MNISITFPTLEDLALDGLTTPSAPDLLHQLLHLQQAGTGDLAAWRRYREIIDLSKLRK